MLLTISAKLQICGTWIALLRRYNALILGKNVLYNKNNDEYEPPTTKRSLWGAYFFAASQGNGKRACVPRVSSSGRKIAS
jgi:hypothetical protein